MKYNAERYLALKKFEREQKRDEWRGLLWSVSITTICGMMIIQLIQGIL